MRYKLLGKSGLKVSELCLGAMTFGDDWGWGSTKEESRKIYDVFVEAGGNFIDTADLYTNGTSERFLGEFMASDRDRIVLATKYTNTAPGTDPNAAGNQRKNMMQSVEASLKRLNTDYIDLYWLPVRQSRPVHLKCRYTKPYPGGSDRQMPASPPRPASENPIRAANTDRYNRC